MVVDSRWEKCKQRRVERMKLIEKAVTVLWWWWWSQKPFWECYFPFPNLPYRSIKNVQKKYTILVSLIIRCFLELFTALVSCSVDLIQCGSSVCRKRKTISFFHYTWSFRNNRLQRLLCRKSHLRKLRFKNYVLLYIHIVVSLLFVKTQSHTLADHREFKIKKMAYSGYKTCAYTHTIQNSCCAIH